MTSLVAFRVYTGPNPTSLVRTDKLPRRLKRDRYPTIFALRELNTAHDRLAVFDTDR